MKKNYFYFIFSAFVYPQQLVALTIISGSKADAIKFLRVLLAKQLYLLMKIEVGKTPLKQNLKGKEDITCKIDKIRGV